MNATRQAQEARAFGWELAELMLEALLGPSTEVEATALGQHAAEVIEERAKAAAAKSQAEDTLRLWTDAACWGFRDRMAIGRELAGSPPEAPPRARRRSAGPSPNGSTSAEAGSPRARMRAAPDADVAALRLIGGRDDEPEPDAAQAAEEPPPERPKRARAKPKPKPAAKPRAKPAPAPKSKRRPKPAPVE